MNCGLGMREFIAVRELICESSAKISKRARSPISLIPNLHFDVTKNFVVDQYFEIEEIIFLAYFISEFDRILYYHVQCIKRKF